MRGLCALTLAIGLIAAIPAMAVEEGGRPEIVDVLTARLATASTLNEAIEVADALRAIYAESASPSAELLYAQSEVVVGDEDGDAALHKLTRALVLDDDLVAALVLRGHVRLETGDVEGAFDDAISAVELAPDYYAGLGLLARTFEAQGRYASALATTREALEYYPLSENLAEQLDLHRGLARGGAGL